MPLARATANTSLTTSWTSDRLSTCAPTCPTVQPLTEQMPFSAALKATFSRMHLARAYQIGRPGGHAHQHPLDGHIVR